MRKLLVTEQNYDVLRRVFVDEPHGKNGMRPGWEIRVPDYANGQDVVDCVIWHATMLSLEQRVG